MIKYRIKVIKDNKNITRYLPQYRKYFIWWSGKVLYFSSARALDELKGFKRNLPFKPFNIYFKDGEL